MNFGFQSIYKYIYNINCPRLFCLVIDALWIGLTDQVEEGAFLWINGEQSSFTDWYDGEPSDHGAPPGEDCVMIWRHHQRWIDGDCDFKAGYICESKI